MPDNRYYVLMCGGDKPWPLNLDPATKRECRAKIAWQRRGGNEERMEIVAWSAPLKAFVDENGRKWEAHRLMYTEEAWSRFLSRLTKA